MVVAMFLIILMMAYFWSMADVNIDRKQARHSVVFYIRYGQIVSVVMLIFTIFSIILKALK